MTTFYATGMWNKYVEPIEVERFNDKSVWINGSRRSRYSAWTNYFQTEDEAWESLIAGAEAKLGGYVVAVQSAEKNLNKIHLARKEKSE